MSSRRARQPGRCAFCSLRSLALCAPHRTSELVTAQGVRHFSPPPPPPSDAAVALEELNAFRVRDKLQGELREDRKDGASQHDAGNRQEVPERQDGRRREAAAAASRSGGVADALTTRLAASRSPWASTFGPQGGVDLKSRALFGAPGSGAPGASGAARRASPFVGETLEERGLEAVASFALRP